MQPHVLYYMYRHLTSESLLNKMNIHSCIRIDMSIIGHQQVAYLGYLSRISIGLSKYHLRNISLCEGYCFAITP